MTEIIHNSLEPISLKITKEIIAQMEKSIVSINIDNKTGTGFFAIIPYKKEIKKVLITNNHIIGENEIKKGKIITIKLNNNENDIRAIKIDEKRKIYSNEILDVTIIEIDENKDGEYKYIEIDDSLKKNMKLAEEKMLLNNKNIYENKSIYIINYTNRISVSYGFLSEINKNKRINHNCNTEKGASGSPILSLENNKLLGMHNDSSEKSNSNKGILIIYPIIEFNQMNNNIFILKKKKPKLNEITIIYKIKGERRIKLFGKKFIENNKNNCQIKIENKVQEITEYLNINEEMRKKKQLEIKLKEIKTITNMSYMFGGEMLNYCKSLLSIPDFSKWDTINVTNMSCMFQYCFSLLSLPDISKWDTHNVTNMSCIFDDCESLFSLPDISKWDTHKVKDMSGMFRYCKSLYSLPDISKWDTKNVTNMICMFDYCGLLQSLPDISKWDTKNVINMSAIFRCCFKISSLPNISKWDTRNVTDMSDMFRFCESLSSLPDISKWDTRNVTEMSDMFYGCNKLSASTIPLKFVEKIN